MRRLAIRALAVVACVAAGALAPFPSTARAAEEVPTLVLLGDAGQTSATAYLEEAIRAQVVDLDVALELRWLEPGDPPGDEELSLLAGLHGARATLWCDVVALDAIAVQVADGGEPRLIRRRLEVDGHSAAGRREVVALVARTVATALPHGAAAVGEALDRIPLVDLESEPDPPAEVAVARRGPALSLSAGLRLRGMEDDHRAVPGVALEIEPGLARHLALSVGYALRPGVQVEGGVADLTLTTHDAHLGLAWWGPIGPLRLVGRAGAELGLTDRRTASPATGYTADHPRLDASLGVVAEARLAIPLSRPLHVEVAGGAVALLVRHRYRVDQGDVALAILEPWPVQPFVAVQLALRFE